MQWKREKEWELEKGKLKFGLSHQKLHPLSLYFPPNCPICQMGFFCNFVRLNQTMVCGVSV